MTLLDHRNNSGLGGKFVFVQNEIMKVDLSGAFLYQYENFKSVSPEVDYRWSARFRAKISPIDILKFQYTYFYIPKIDDYKSYRLKLDTSLSIKIDKYFSFKVGASNAGVRSFLLSPVILATRNNLSDFSWNLS